MSNTIESIEQDYWGEPEFDSHLVKTCHALRKKPIGQFSASDLRIMIGQDIGTEHLLPRALAFLDSNPLVLATFYEGDLLNSIISLPDSFWKSNPQHLQGTMTVAKKAIEKIYLIGQKESARQMRLYGASLDPKTEAHEHSDILKKLIQFSETYKNV